MARPAIPRAALRAALSGGVQGRHCGPPPQSSRLGSASRRPRALPRPPLVSAASSGSLCPFGAIGPLGRRFPPEPLPGVPGAAPPGRIDRGSVLRSDCVRVQLLQRIQADVARGRHDAGCNGLRQTVQRDPRIATDLGRRCRGNRRRKAMRRAIRGGPATDLGRQLQRRGATDCGRPRGEAVATDCGRPDVRIKTDPRFPTRFCDATAAPGGALQRSAATSAQIRCNVCRKRLPGLPESVGPSARNGCR